MPITKDGGSDIKIGMQGSIVVETINKWGEQIDVDTADAALGQVLWPIKATVQAYPFLFTPIPMTLQSNSALDVNGSSGADTVEIIYQTLEEEKKVILAVTGTVPVDLPEDNVGCFRMRVLTSGSNNTNVGNITIENSGTIYTQINAGQGQTRISVQRIPGNRIGTVKSHRISYAKTTGKNDALVDLVVKSADGTKVIKWPVGLISLKAEDIKNYFIGGITVQPGEFVYWECSNVGANGTPLRGSFDVEMEVL